MTGRRILSAGVVGALLAACLCVVLARIVTPRTAVMAALAAASPVVAVVAGACVLIAATALARRDSVVFRWLFGTALALVLVQTWWFAPLVVGGQPPRPPGAVTVGAMTLNTLGGRADAAQIVATVRSHHIGILVLTEMTDAGLAELERRGITRELPHHVAVTAATGSATVVFTRTPIIGSEPIATSAGGLAVTTLVRSRPVVVLAAHPATPERIAAWRSGLAEVAAAARRESADLVIGDLNATIDHRPFRDLLADGRYRDGAELANVGWEPTFPANWIRRILGIPLPTMVQLDHILVRDDGGASSLRTVRVDGTDHLGVFADIWLPAAPRPIAPS